VSDLEPPFDQLTPAALEVYADQLLERGDVQGEFIHLQCARAASDAPTAREQELEQQLEQRVLAAAGLEHRFQRPALGWRLGVLDSVSLDCDDTLATVATALSRWPGSRALRELTVVGASHSASLGGLLRVAPELRFPVLESFTAFSGVGLGGPVRELEIEISGLGPLARAFPRLRRLSLEGLIDGDFGALHFPELREFSAETLAPGAVNWLVKARWPKLETLRLRFYAPGDGVEPVFGALLDAPMSPVLAKVHLETPWPEYFAAALPRSKLGKGRELIVT